MKKLLTFTLLSSLLLCSVFADDFDDLFMDDGIDEMTAPADERSEELNHGALFETGSVKIGGTFNTSVSTLTTLYADDGKDFGAHVNDTTLTPALSAFLTVDARPTQTLRMYTKFGLAYPFASTAYSSANTSVTAYGDNHFAATSVSTSVTDYLKVKELFTDFSVADRAFFRFGLHTVTWGTGYFFSPVSDIINKSSINPEDTSAQVDGSLNLRTQITFPGTQNCLWFYVIPGDLKTINASTSSYLRETAFAAKGDLVFGNWEFGLGGYYKYQGAPKTMITATGSLKKMSIFGEAVYQYGGDSEWKSNPDWENKTNIFQATAGVSYFWKTPSITLAAQYYYDGNNVDKTSLTGADFSKYGVQIPSAMQDTLFLSIPRFYQGHNVAFLANFGRIFGTTDFTATIFGMMNFDRADVYVNPMITAMGTDVSAYTNLTSAIFSAMLSYAPTSSLKFSMGPYITMTAFDKPPVVSLKLQATLGGGKF